MSVSLVRVRDEALPAPLFRRLRQAVRAVGEERLARTYQTTFWFDLDLEPSCLVEVAALTLSRAALTGDQRARVRGVEWWLSRMRTDDVRVDFHQDHDIAREQRTGRMVRPVVSSVLFLNRARGGLLALSAERPNPKNPSCAPDHLDRLDLVRPSPNRFAVFPGSTTHGVLDHLNQVPADGRRRPKDRGGHLRLAVILNWWISPPVDVPRFSERRVYRALARPGM